METVLRIAVQKKGRLSEKTIELIKNCGIKFTASSGRLKAQSHNFPMEFLFLRDDDIPGYVADGVADIGVLGMNEVEEKAQPVDVVEHLGFSKCRLSIAVHNHVDYTGSQWLNGKKIATSYPVILKKFLDENSINAEIHEISGSVEIAPTIGLTDAICDIVSTGSTLLSNGLKEVEQIYKSDAVLITHKNLSDEKKQILDKFMMRLKSVNRAQQYKYIILNTPNSSIEKISNILPGMKSPTVTPLAVEGWSALYSVVKEDEFWEIADQLHQEGAEGILVLPIEKMIF